MTVNKVNANIDRPIELSADEEVALEKRDTTQSIEPASTVVQNTLSQAAQSERRAQAGLRSRASLSGMRFKEQLAAANKSMPAEKTENVAQQGLTYTVKAGDTLSSISRQYGVTLQSVIAANPQIKNPNIIHPGQVINLPPSALIPPAKAKEIIAAKAKEVIAALKSKDMAKLSTLVHPDKGVRFSPYAFVNKGKDLVFNAAKVKSFSTDKTKYSWGEFDGSGQPIQLTANDYFKRFVFDKDFSKSTRIGYNQTIGSGNSTNNVFEAYPKSIVAEYYLPGTTQNNGMDWKSLRLVFEQKGQDWYLSGIAHDEWTI